MPGDGSCGPSSASAFLFKDEVFGKKLRRGMNRRMAKHWYKRYQFITQCSEDHPFIRKLGGGEVRFTDPLELIKYLDTSEEAANMWTDSEDLSVISDMYQVKIKVITTAGEKDENPTVNLIYPDPDLKEFAELKDVDMEEMVLLHQKDFHFDLIVSKDSVLAKDGSLSYQSNIGPLLDASDVNDSSMNSGKGEEEVNNIEAEIDCVNDLKTKEIKELKKELNKMKENKKLLEENYSKCELRLRNKTEEVEMLKVEVNDLKKIVELEEQLKTNEEDTGQTGDKSNNFTEIVTKQRSRRNRRVEPEYNCTECSYQGTEKEELTKHMNIKHRADGSMRCRNCGEPFSSRSNLLEHRKDMHADVVAPCRNYLSGNCPYSNLMCWWSHDNQPRQENTSVADVRCYICNETFTSKTNMMSHRKIQHRSILRECNLFKDNKCRFKEESCWFKHENIVENDAENEHGENASQKSVFQKVQENLKPPFQDSNQQKMNQKQ